MRKLKGKLTIAIQGALPVEGAPETASQTGWKGVLAKYKEHQPDVEVVIEDLPEGQTGEQWCEAKKLAKQMPDITYVGECNYFRPTVEEVQRGLNIASDFKAYETEVNPYSGLPWKDDWFNDSVRLARCTENGAADMWTCQTIGLGGGAIWVNWDILKEFGYDGTFPKTMTELWDLSDKINKSGKYVAWDSPAFSQDWIARSLWTNLTMDRYVAAGGDLKDIQASNPKVYGNPNATPNWCNGLFQISSNPSVTEAAKQWKRYIDAFPGGGPAFWDPAREQQPVTWLTGQAAMSHHHTGMFGLIVQAEQDATLAVKNWGVQRLPKITKDDLIDKSVEIAFDGEPFMWGGGGGDVFAPTPNVRASGEDANVDLLIRDWFQFMSAEGIGILYSSTRGIPLNPRLMSQMDPRLKDWLTMKPDIFTGISQPPGTYVNPYWQVDTEKNMAAWSAEQADFETAMKRAEENILRGMVKSYDDAKKDAGWPELPETCTPYKTQ